MECSIQGGTFSLAGERTKILRQNPTPAAAALTALSFLVFTAAEEEGELGPDMSDKLNT